MIYEILKIFSYICQSVNSFVPYYIYNYGDLHRYCIVI